MSVPSHGSHRGSVYREDTTANVNPLDDTRRQSLESPGRRRCQTFFGGSSRKVDQRSSAGAPMAYCSRGPVSSGRPIALAVPHGVRASRTAGMRQVRRPAGGGTNGEGQVCAALPTHSEDARAGVCKGQHHPPFPPLCPPHRFPMKKQHTRSADAGPFPETREARLFL